MDGCVKVRKWGLLSPPRIVDILGDTMKVKKTIISTVFTFNKCIYCTYSLADDFNFFFDISLESYGRKPTLKKKSVAKFIELKEKFDLCNIWRIRNLKPKRYTFRQKYVSGLIQRRLGYLWLFPIPCKSLSKILTLEARSFRLKR